MNLLLTRASLVAWPSARAGTRTRYWKWYDDLGSMFVARDNNLPCFRIIGADMKQYLINKPSCVIICVIQGSKLFSMVVRDVAIHRS
jgi:hypothetical protein